MHTQVLQPSTAHPAKTTTNYPTMSGDEAYKRLCKYGLRWQGDVWPICKEEYKEAGHGLLTYDMFNEWRIAEKACGILAVTVLRVEQGKHGPRKTPVRERPYGLTFSKGKKQKEPDSDNKICPNRNEILERFYKATKEGDTKLAGIFDKLLTT